MRPTDCGGKEQASRFLLEQISHLRWQHQRTPIVSSVEIHKYHSCFFGLVLLNEVTSIREDL